MFLAAMPVRTRGEWEYADHLGRLLAPTAEERVANGWVEGYDGNGARQLQCSRLATFTRELTEAERRQLLALVNDPPEGVGWRYSEKAAYDALVMALGGTVLVEGVWQ